MDFLTFCPGLAYLPGVLTLPIPLFYALSSEPLAARIRAHYRIQGLRMAVVEEKIAFYADDLIVFLAGSGESLSTSSDMKNLDTTQA